MKKILILIFLLSSFYYSFSQHTENVTCRTRLSYPFKFNKTKYVEAYNYDLTYYKLEFKVDPKKRYINGIVTSHFIIINDNFNEISFDLTTKLKVDDVKYHNKSIKFTHSNNILNIKFSKPITKGIKDSLTVYYQGVPDDGGFGTFEQSKHNGEPIIWTLSEPYGAKDWWPCKQNLSDKPDSIDLYVTAPKKYKVASNGLLISETIVKDDKITHWKHRHPIAAYLIAFAVTNYEVYNDYAYIGNDTVTITNYVYPEHLSDAKQKTPSTAKLLELYSKLFVPYPFKDEKYGHAEFGWGGGMEHQTMSFMGNFNFSLIAHELAHQWFGDYVTCGSWHDIWLNEGFAVYLEGLAYEHKLSSYSWKSWKRNKIWWTTMRTDGSVYVNDVSDVGRIFDNRLTYNKSAMVLHMLRWELGDEIFYKSIRNYLNDPKLKHAYAKTNNLQSHFEKVSGKDLQYFFDNWIYGQGYPIYKIIWRQDKNNITRLNIYQKTSHNSVDFYKMKVPIGVKSDSRDTTMVFEHTESGQEFIFDPGFKIKEMVFDPDIWIVTKNPSFQKKTNESIDEFSFSPNPAKKTLSINSLNSSTVEKINIYTLYGKEVLNIKPNFVNNKYKIKVSSLKSGIYIIKIETEDDIYTNKFIKK